MRLSKRLTTLTLLAVPLVAAAQPEANVIDLTLRSYAIEPAQITVTAGQPVTLRLRNSALLLPHNLAVHAPEAGIDFKVDVSAGQAATVIFTPTLPGRYEMSCDKKPPFGGRNHKERGMQGVIEVVP